MKPDNIEARLEKLVGLLSQRSYNYTEVLALLPDYYQTRRTGA